MHDMRVHSKKLGTGYKWKKKKLSPSDSAAYKHKVYIAQRDRWRALGLNAHGKPFSTRWGAQRSGVTAPKLKGNPRSLANLKRGGTKWTPERTAKFKRTMRRIAREKSMRQAGGKPPHPNSLAAKKRIQFVYPTPDQIDAAVRATPNMINPPTTAIRFCPHCGNNIEKHL